MAVSQLGKKQKFVATAVLIELKDEDEEPIRKRGKARAGECELMLEDTRFDVRG